MDTSDQHPAAPDAAIAIVGLSCRFPGAPDAARYWTNLRDAVDCLTPLTDRDLAAAGVPPALAADPSYVRAAYLLDRVDEFDAAFFGYSPREAELMDPQHRLFLQCAWQALEDAGCVAQDHPGAIGVFASARLSTYLLNNVPRGAAIGTGDSFQALLGNDKDYLSTRVSYKLNLRGPSLTVQTACSSSLVAVHMACESLRSGESDVALAGGAAVSVPQGSGYVFQDGMIFSRDGRCRPFDASAGGTAIGNGVGVVALKRLADALEDDDAIYAVIRGTAVNNDGASKVGFTAPSVEGQQRVVAEALAMAEVDPATVGYVETHGTGTPLGDPIEIEALTRVFRARTRERGFCAIGSVKGNLGHMDTAAGVASLIKTALALEAREIPPLMHFSQPNPRIDFAASPFFVPTAVLPWERRGGAPRRAGVSSFGIGGTNAHAVLEEAPAPRPRAPANGHGPRVLTLSARSPATLRALAEAYVQKLPAAEAGGEPRRAAAAAQPPALGDLCASANTRRAHHPWRAAVVSSSVEELRDRLGALGRGEEVRGAAVGRVAAKPRPQIAFVFSGQGSQRPGMGRGLYESEPVFRAAVDRCGEALGPELPVSLRDVLFGAESAALVGNTRYTQPALLSLQWALCELWRSWGVEPSFVLGHSVGEYAAACVAGVMPLEDALRLVAARGRLIGELPRTGAMAAILAPEEAMLRLLEPERHAVTVAAVNGPEQVVVSGAADAVTRVVEAAQAAGLVAKPLSVSHAFHSPLLDPILEPFGRVVSTARLARARLPLASNVTGALAGDEVLDPEYWVRHVRAPVRYAAGVHALHEAGARLFLELGPDDVLAGMGRRLTAGGSATWLASLRAGDEEREHLLGAAGALYVAGADVRWAALDPERRRRVRLPAYPFDRKRHWVTPHAPAEPPQAPGSEAGAERLWASLLEAGEAGATAGAGALRLQDFPARDGCLRDLSLAYVGRALAKLGALGDPSRPATLDELRRGLAVVPRYHQLLGRLLERLVDAGRLRREGEGYAGLTVTGDAELSRLLGEAGRHAREVPEILAFIRRCGESFAEVLAGQANPRAIIFPEGAVDTLEAVYENTAEAKYLNGIAAALAKRLGVLVPRDRALRVLEIGGGVGGTTAWVLPALPERTAYTFTDVSPVFLANARTRFGVHPGLRCALLDAERRPEDQGFAAGGFDVVVASNVLHALRDLHLTLEHVAALLAPGGLLLVREITRDIPWFDYTLGTLLQELDDAELRPRSPFLSAPAWRDLAGRHGFDRAVTFPGEGAPAEVVGEHILLARRAPAAGRPRAFESRAAAAHAATPGAGAPERPAPAHPLLQRRLLAPTPAFELQLEGQTFPWLLAHQVFGMLVVPGTLFLELADAAAREVLGGAAPLELHEVTYGEPLVLRDGATPRLGHVSVKEEGPGRISLRLHSFEEATGEGEAGRWRLHLSAGARRATSGADAVPPLARVEVQARCGTALDAARLYAAMGRSGVQYGPEFRGIRELWRGEHEALGRLELPVELEGRVARYRMHPAFLDACLQVAVAASGIDPADVQAVAYMPVGADAVELLRESPRALWCHAVTRAGHGAHGPDAGALPDTLIADVVAFAEDGRPVARLRGLYLKRAAREAVERAVDTSAADLYQVRWLPLAEAGAPPPPPAAGGAGQGPWLVAGGPPEERQALAAALERQGCPCEPLPGGAEPATVRDALGRALERSRAQGASVGGVVLLAGGAAAAGQVPGTRELEGAQREGCGALLAMLPLLTVPPGSRAPALLLTTRAATPAGAEPGPVDPTHATLLGLGRVVAQEHPELRCTALDLEAGDGPGDARLERDAEMLRRVIEGAPQEDQLAARGGQLLVPRLVPARGGMGGGGLAVRPDASYLITGGLGGIGLQVAGLLARRGARHLVLLGRRGAPADPAGAAALEALRATGAAVHLVEGDVADASEGSPLRRVFSELGRSLPALRGVIHAAGVLDDGPLLELGWDRFAGVLSPKVSGAWNLHRLTRSLELDFFVLFSSVATLFGLPGQGNYGAANAFLDALAHARRREGLPALSIDWGAWAETGAVAGHRHGAFVASAGVLGLSTARGLELLERAAATGAPHLAAVHLDLSRLFGSYPVGGEPPLLRELAKAARRAAGAGEVKAGEGAAASATLRAELGAKPEGERVTWMAAHLRRRIAELLRVSPEEVPEETNLIQLGLDSLMFLNLVRTLGEDFQIKLVPHKAFERPTVRALGERVVAEVFPVGARPGGGEAAPTGGTGVVAEAAALRPDPGHRFEPFPLTDIQQAYWVGRTGTWEMGNVAGHVFYELDAADLDLDRLMGAWRRLIDRHEMLRVVIQPDGTQRILEEVPPFQPRVLDLRPLEPAEAEARLLEVREEMSRQALAVERWPLFDLRASLLRDRLRLHVDLDLLVADLASAQILLGELLELYRDPRAHLAPLEVSFRDCALAAASLEGTPAWEAARSYWLARVSTLPPPPALPLAVDPRAVVSPRFRRRTFRLDAGGWRKLRERARAAELTPSGLLAAVYAEVLRRWSGSPRFTLNLTLFNRPPLHPGIGAVVGDFTSVNLLEVGFEDGQPFQARAQALQRRLLADLGHRQFSGVRVLRELARVRPDRSHAMAPIVFTSAIGLGDRGPEDTLGALGTIVHSITQTPQVWLDYQAMEQGGGLLCNWDAVEELFPPGLLDDMFEAHAAWLRRLASE